MDRTLVSHFNFKTDIYCEDLQKVLDKVERNNGKVIVRKRTLILQWDMLEFSF